MTAVIEVPHGFAVPLRVHQAQRADAVHEADQLGRADTAPHKMPDEDGSKRPGDRKERKQEGSANDQQSPRPSTSANPAHDSEPLSPKRARTIRRDTERHRSVALGLLPRATSAAPNRECEGPVPHLSGDAVAVGNAHLLSHREVPLLRQEVLVAIG